ncbi:MULTISPECIES: tryptophan--tRNA ligase [Kosmotoga]|uniref:Tryptophan--tRNA ligase n=1 Tax=Kosmotoga olearia (strain ATCC BAA-1733 / DSM 21960 / TBF 19.5.1) TaxID=521045 RepID=C5CGJ2_KOSOT|nr:MULTISPECIES: tryptophan--tRNA ligase [Kosmotoga]ACR79574.1 tryptophanyl-tRNA synthetase [Kosmotoga olearia TBF 19.5.1]MDI3523912.1 tryptophanyl-tRNA synthetase [Kosmotoga sp.]MDK2953309.1 tryptophanyl-tRNA synthetase [Kosmotoga sp.]OAA22123.1 tryptophan--tRNA ligase [Kosmotoga sp. DU53]
MRVLSGMRSTGKLHLGNLTALERWVELQNEGNECYFFVADWHALTSHIDSTNNFAGWSLDIVKIYVAAGLDPEKSVIFIQSAVKEHAELFLLFSMLVSVSRLERIPTYKEQKQQINDRDLSSAGFLLYPVLQAADILMYRAHGVPVGEDQVYHIELTREIARRFNNLFGEVFPEPEPILAKVAKLPGTDGRKMSKSYNNFIPIDTDEKQLWKMIAPMMTDPARKRRTDPGDPEKCPVWEYHKAFTHSQEELDWVVNGCKTAGIGCIDCKKLLHKNLSAKLSPIWEKLREFDKNPEEVKKIIKEGNAKARAFAQETMRLVYDAMKFGW